MDAIEVVSGARRLGGETAEQILAQLVDGYARAGDEEARRTARLNIALHVRARAQDLLNAGEAFELATPEEKAILMYRGEEPPPVAGWRCAIPLVLITAFYHPLGELPRPEVAPPGQVWWIDHTTAEALLGSLHGVRWLDLSLSNELEPWRFESESYPNLGTNGAAGYRWRSIG